MVMRRPMGIRMVARTMVMVVLAFGVAFGALVSAPGGRGARAQDEPLAAAVVRGDCGDLGEVAVDLRPLKENDGGVLTSFTTIDLAIGELMGGGYAVVAGDPDAPVACGDLTGTGDDAYVAAPAQNDSGLGGIVWLHARGKQTQVTLFLGEGIGGGDGAGPVEDPNAPPEPPDAEETPEPTDEPSADLEVYTAPNFEYSIAYDPAQWIVRTAETQPGAMGPVDYLALINTSGTALAEFVGMLAPVLLPAPAFLANLVDSFREDPTVKEVTVRTDDEGKDLVVGDATHAYLVFDIVATNDMGKEFAVTIHAEVWQMPAVDGLLGMIYQTPQGNYERDAPMREALVQGISLPQ